MTKPKNIETPEILNDHFQSYKAWVKDNPWIVEDFVGKDGQKVDRKKPIPLTWFGFELWLRENGILCDLSDYLSNKDKRYSEYAPIIRAIKNEIYNHKYIGGSVGIFQQNIIARDLGLVEKQQQEITQELIVTVPDEEIPEHIKKQYDEK